MAQADPRSTSTVPRARPGARGRLPRDDFYDSIGLTGVVSDPRVLNEVIGSFVIALGLAVLAVPATSLLVFVCAWKLATEFLFVTAGAYGAGFEVIERACAYAAPIALIGPGAIRPAATISSTRGGSAAELTPLSPAFGRGGTPRCSPASAADPSHRYWQLRTSSLPRRTANAAALAACSRPGHPAKRTGAARSTAPYKRCEPVGAAARRSVSAESDDVCQ